MNAAGAARLGGRGGRSARDGLGRRVFNGDQGCRALLGLLGENRGGQQPRQEKDKTEQAGGVPQGASDGVTKNRWARRFCWRQLSFC